MAKSKVFSEQNEFEAIGLTLHKEVAMGSSTHEEYGLKYKDIVYVMKYREKYPKRGADLPLDFVKFFIPYSTWFEKKKKGRKDDWLAKNKEPSQSFIQYLQCGIAMPFGRFRTIYIFPISFAEEHVPKEILGCIKTFAEIFFQLPVKTMKRKNLSAEVTNRIDEVYQADAHNIVDVMNPLVPSDAFCAIGITMCDLYHETSSNLFGHAVLSGKCGVCSIARYLGNFGKTKTSVYEKESEEDGKSLIIKRICKTMCHEIGHMFGLRHCVFYECLMNGSNSLEEADRHPLFLCPVCLRKLQFACKFNIEERYKQMVPFCLSHDMTSEAHWLQTRLETWEKE
ncbi:archaemetzincin-2-like isoform X1 [Mytilus edulis]|uniref:archaemetzincin-2-like isoform X1 n=2 Tax=Mytilus edulis TaxID=6550 RepID=UPI0039EF938C